MSGYIDLALSKEDVEKQYASTTTLGETQKYPYCTTFELSEQVLEEIDHADWSVDDMFHFHIMAKITAIRSHEDQNGAKKCVTFQMTAIKGENEDSEDNEEDGEGIANEGGYLKYATS